VAALQILRGKDADVSQEAEEIQVKMCYCWIYFCDLAFRLHAQCQRQNSKYNAILSWCIFHCHTGLYN